MAKDPFDALLARMAETGVATSEMLEGCTPAEIRRLERRYGVTLPATYRRFLAVMGRRSGRLFTHDWVTANYPNIAGETADLRAQLADAGGYELSADAVVVLARDAEQYNFIRCDRPDDSPVWAIDLGAVRVRPRQFRVSVVGWLRAWAGEAAEAVADGWYERDRG
jgi:hypothetical protein